MNVKTIISEHEMTSRQGEILDIALSLLVSSGGNLTMSSLVKAANCSKETLYNWFGDRDGLLIATIQWQASKVREPKIDLKQIDINSLENALSDFASDLLGVLSSEISVALNRLAISHSNSKDSELGKVVLDNGRLAMGRRIKPLLRAAKKKSLLAYKSDEEAFRTLFGLIVRDVQIRLLLGDEIKYSKAKINKEARLAIEQFLTLYQN